MAFFVLSGIELIYVFHVKVCDERELNVLEQGLWCYSVTIYAARKLLSLCYQ